MGLKNKYIGIVLIGLCLEAQGNGIYLTKGRWYYCDVPICWETGKNIVIKHDGLVVAEFSETKCVCKEQKQTAKTEAIGDI